MVTRRGWERGPVLCCKRDEQATHPPTGDHEGHPNPTSSSPSTPTKCSIGLSGEERRIGIPAGRPLVVAPPLPTKRPARPVHSRGDGLSSPWGGVVALYGSPRHSHDLPTKRPA